MGTDSYNWNYVDRLTQGEVREESTPYTFTSGGNFTYTVMVTSCSPNESSTSNNSNTITVFVNTPPTAPSNPVPANGAINIPVTTNSLDWANSTDANGDAIQYDVYFGTDPSPDAGELLGTFSNSNFTGLSSLNYGTTYYWQIIARDSRGATTPGPVWNFTTQIAQPDIIVESIRSEPPNPQIGQEVLLYAVIRNNGPAGAELINWTYNINGSQVGTDSYNWNFVDRLTQGEVREESTPYTFTSGGNFTYTVTVTSCSPNESSTSNNSNTITVFVNTPPTAPTNPVPANGAINIPVTTNSLDWANSTDANGDAIQYEVYFGTDASPDAGEYLTTVSTSNFSGLPSLNYGTPYYWQIVARDSRGATTPGPVWSFTTQIAQPDIIVESIRCEPPNPQIGQEVLLYAVIRNNGPAGAEIINWTYSINGSQVGTDSYNWNYVDRLTQGEVREESTPYTFTSGGNFTYTVMVTSCSPNESSTSNNSNTITVFVNTPPTIPSNPVPANGAINIPVTTNSLDWANSTDANGDAIQYDVYFGTDPSPDAGELLGTFSNSNFTGLPSLNYGTTYYWQIIARDSRGATTPGPVWNFTTRIAQPDLIVQNQTVTPTAVYSGSNITASCLVRNIGNASADFPITQLNGLYYYLSTDNIYDASDIQLGTSNINNLPADATQTVSGKTLTIPANTPSGNYNILFYIDRENDINEYSESNNVAFVQITVNSEQLYAISFDIIDNAVSRHFAGNVNLKVYESPSNWNTVLFDQISQAGYSLSWFDAPVGIHPYEVRNQNPQEYWGTGEVNVTGTAVVEIPRTAPYETGFHLPYKELKTSYTTSDIYYGNTEETAAEIGVTTIYIPVTVYNPCPYGRNARATVYVNQNQLYSNPLAYKTISLAANETRTVVFDYKIPSNIAPNSLFYIDVQVEAEYNSHYEITDRENGWESFMVKSYIAPAYVKELFFPQNGDINVPRSSPIYIAFNKDMDVSSVTNPNNFKVLVNGQPIPGTIEYDNITKYGTFTPANRFEDNINVNVQLGSFRDINGNLLTENYSYSFQVHEVTEKILNVPYYWQGNTYYCWATSLSMWFKYYGEDKKYWEIANDNNEERLDPFFFGSPIQFIWSYWNYSNNLKFKLGKNESEFKQLVKTSIIYNNPVFYYCSRGSILKTGHAIVFIGYRTENNTEYVIYHDPHWGSNITVTWEEFFDEFEYSTEDIAFMGKNTTHPFKDGIFTTQFYFDTYPSYTPDEYLNSNINEVIQNGKFTLKFINSINTIDQIALIPDGSKEEGYYYMGSRNNLSSVPHDLGKNAKKSDLVKFQPFITHSYYSGFYGYCTLRLLITNKNTNQIVDVLEKQVTVNNKCSLEPSDFSNPVNFQNIINNQFGVDNEFQIDLSQEKFIPGLYQLKFEVFKNNNSLADDNFEVLFNLEDAPINDIQKPIVSINSINNSWFNISPLFNIDFSDNQSLNNIWYQIDSNDDSNPANWHNLTSDGINTLPGSQNNSGSSLTTDWKISDVDWNNLTINAQNGGKHYLYFKVTDDAGNEYITPDQSSAFEFGKDIFAPSVYIVSPASNQTFNSNQIEVSWNGNDMIAGLELSGIDKYYYALDQNITFTEVDKTVNSNIFSNLSNGVHTVYVKAKDFAGNESQVKSISFSIRVPANLLMVLGNNQSAPVNTILDYVFRVRVTDASGYPVQGIEVVFNIASFPPGATGQSLNRYSHTTDSEGNASTLLTLGNLPGQYVVNAQVEGLNGSPVIFTATATQPNVPVLNCDQSNFNFGDVELYSFSAPTTISITGSNLSDNITVSCPPGFQVAHSDIGPFNPSLILTQNSGSVNSLVYIIFSPTNVAYYSGNLNISSSGANSINVFLNGNGVEEDNPPFVNYNEPNSVWYNQSHVFRMELYDDHALDGVWYQIDSNNDTNPANWHNLTSDGTNITLGIPNNDDTFRSVEWMINDADWNNLSNGWHHLYFKVTDVDGNAYITPNQESAFRFGKDIIPPNLTITSPVQGQLILGNSVEVKWLVDDLFENMNLSGIELIGIAIDQNQTFTNLPENQSNYLFNNLSTGEHFVYLLTKDLAGNFSLVESIGFYIQTVPELYCSAGSTECDEHIANVSIGNINNSTSCSTDGYSDFSAISTNIARGTSLRLDVTNGNLSYPEDQCGIWVDWNNNGNFLDDEPVIVSVTPGTGPYSAQITCPVDALPGPKRLRIRIHSLNEVSSPCGYSRYGEVEDYTLNVTAGYNISGKFMYKDSLNTPIADGIIELFNSDDSKIAEKITDEFGNFIFSNLSNGSYKLWPYLTGQWIAASGNDLLAYMKHIGNAELLPPFLALSGDVNLSNSLTAMDLSYIRKRIVNEISNFPSGDWLCERPVVTINGYDMVQDIYAICYGDAIGSYQNPAKSSAELFIADDETAIILDNNEFNVPLKLTGNATDLSAVTLYFSYPSEFLDLKDIKMADNNQDLYYYAKDGTIRLVYASLNSLDMHEGDVLLKLRFALKENLTGQQLANFNFQLSGRGEFADYHNQVLPGISMLYASGGIKTFIESAVLKEIKIFPNPARKELNITHAEDATIELFDMHGKLLLSKKCFSDRMILDVSAFEPANYVIKITRNNVPVFRTITIEDY